VERSNTRLTQNNSIRNEELRSGEYFKPHTEGTEAQRFLEHRGELALAGRAQKEDGGMRY
jgi:hypothetical protein